MKRFSLFVLGLLLFSSLLAHEVSIYPSHWWVGMKDPKLQLLVHGDNIAGAGQVQLQYPGVRLGKVHRFANPNYLAIDLVITTAAKPGKMNLRIGTNRYEYALRKRVGGNGNTRVKGVDASDFIYLIMPDRFSNGDPSNDRVPGMKDQSLRRDTIYERHGGDLKGVENKLDYLQQLGITTVWLNPVIENDMPSRTEHGYAFTNHYRIDPRLGGEAAYHSLVKSLHARGMKIIQDAVYNHTGIEHHLFRDMPDSSWFHRWPTYTQTSYKEQPLFDPYASGIDKKIMSDGWFVPAMPDVNQRNPFFATFLIQHAIWTTEEFGIDGWRIDTYPYNDLDFMNRCNAALLNEFPKIHLFGETWVHGVLNQAFFARNNLNIPFKSNLPGVTDFQTHMYGILPALKEPFGWTEGVNKLYNTLAQDFVYKDPMRNVNFLDNHDKTRFYSEIGENLKNYKMGVAWLLTTRGIPQIYYGTEILMKGVSNPDGWVRLDFPGGWAEDSINKFSEVGRTSDEQDAFRYLQALAMFRKSSPAITRGKFTQYVPQDGVYTYFRHGAGQSVMVVMNTSDKEQSIGLNRFSESLKGFASAREVASGSRVVLADKLSVPAHTAWVLELMQ